MAKQGLARGRRRSRRCRPLRVERDDTLWFVTCRTIEERFWLHPLISSGLEPPNRRTRRAVAGFAAKADRRFARMAARANARRGPLQPPMDPATVKRIARGLVGSALARAQRHCHVQLFAVVVMGNHVHLVVRTPRKNLAAFMGYFKARVADGVNRITGKRGPLWARRYDAQPILDDEAAADRVAYAIDNSVSANLVERSDDWPSLNLAYGMADADRLPFEYLDCTRWHRARRPVDLQRFFATAVLELSPLPSCEGMDRATCRQAIAGWVKNRRRAVRRKAGEKSLRQPARCLGLAKVVDTGFDARSRSPSFSRRPYAFGSRPAREEHFAQMQQLTIAHAEASERFLAGHRNTTFPSGTYPPPILAAA